MIPDGIEPSSPGCEPGVLPLDDRIRQRCVRESNPCHDLDKVACSPLHQRTEGAGTQGIEPQSPGSEPGVIAVIPRPSSAGGSRTHTQLFLKQIALPVSVPRRAYVRLSSLTYDPVEEAGVEPAVSCIPNRWVTFNPFPRVVIAQVTRAGLSSPPFGQASGPDAGSGGRRNRTA